MNENRFFYFLFFGVLVLGIVFFFSLREEKIKKIDVDQESLKEKEVVEENIEEEIKEVEDGILNKKKIIPLKNKNEFIDINTCFLEDQDGRGFYCSSFGKKICKGKDVYFNYSNTCKKSYKNDLKKKRF